MVNQKKCGVIYVLTNPSFPDFVKIGYADNLNQRLQQLNESSCIPFAFRPYAICEVDRRLVDLEIHALIDDLNPKLRAKEIYNGKERVREFFAMPAEKAFDLLKRIAGLFGNGDRVQKCEPTKSQIQTDIIVNALKEKVEMERPSVRALAFLHITKEQIIFAANFIDKQGVPSKYDSITRNVIVNNKKYAPKYTMAIAYLHAGGVAESELAQKVQEQRLLNQFNTISTFPIYKKLGFQIEAKDE